MGEHVLCSLHRLRIRIVILPMQIKTKRLLIRPYEVEDAESLTRLIGDPVIAATTLNIPHPYTIKDAHEFIGKQESDRNCDRSFNLAIIDKDTQTLVGGIGLSLARDHDRAELGYWIGFDYRNSGYATEASVAVIEHGFCELELNHIEAHHLADNDASGRVMEKAGMRRIGIMPQYVKKDGKYIDIVMYCILRDENTLQTGT